MGLRWSLSGIFFVFCFFYGAAFALFAPKLVLPLLILWVFPVALILWAMPDGQKAPTGTLVFLFFAQFAIRNMWPAYLAVQIPGWPWLSPQRISQICFVLAFLACLSGSEKFRSNISAVMGSVPWLTRLVFFFVLLQFVSIGYSANIFGSLDQFVIDQIMWTAVFAAGCFVFLKKGRAETMAGLLLIGAIVLCPLGIWEYHLGHLPWEGHIPSFLQVHDESESVQRTLAGQGRYGQHRVQAIFEISLSFAEYLALMFPFALHIAVNAYKPLLRIGAALAMPLMLYVIFLTQSRLGLVGVFVALVLYPMGHGIILFMRKKTALIPAAIANLSPLIILIAVANAFVPGPIHRRLFGTATVEGSTQARYDQLHLGIPKILHHPWGYGIGQGGGVLDYHSPGGLLTIDSYWLRLAMDYGPVGLVLFLAIFISALIYAARSVLAGWQIDREVKLLLPLGCAIAAFVVITLTFAQEQNFTIAYVFLSMIAALAHRVASNKAPGAVLP